MNLKNKFMIDERMKFYANTPRGEKNKQFCYKTNIIDLSEAIKRFYKQGFEIRALWYEKIDSDTGELLENIRVPTKTLQRLFDEVYSETTKNRSFNKQKNSN